MLSVGQETEEFTSAGIVDAAVDSLRAGRHHYTSVNGNLDLRRAVAQRHFELSGRKVGDFNCAIFAGAQNALFAVAQCLLEKGDEVILSEPYYTTYPATFGASGATLVSVPVKFENQFQINPDDILKAITPRTRAIVLNSPNNPVGAVYTREQYAAVVRACVEKEIWLINDDVYQELLSDDERANPLSLPDAERVCITVSSLSKSHRMTGWRLGWVIGPDALMRHLYNPRYVPVLRFARVHPGRGGRSAQIGNRHRPRRPRKTRPPARHPAARTGRHPRTQPVQLRRRNVRGVRHQRNAHIRPPLRPRVARPPRRRHPPLRRLRRLPRLRGFAAG